jgi:uncharacterized membrane protein
MAQADETRPQEVERTTTSPSSSIIPVVKLAPRWQALIGVIAIGILNAALPPSITFGPSWLLLAIELILMIPLVLEEFTSRTLPYRIRRTLALLLLGVVTFGLVITVALLIFTLSNNTPTQAIQLLRTAALTWVSNILVFALWYWEIDGGGPTKRHRQGHRAADFMFPQQADGNTSGWVPHFLDYVFLAFTAATALSPTDTFPLSRTAKALMMIEALISLVVVVLLAARAVNIL